MKVPEKVLERFYAAGAGGTEKEGLEAALEQLRGELEEAIGKLVAAEPERRSNYRAGRLSGLRAALTALNSVLGEAHTEGGEDG